MFVDDAIVWQRTGSETSLLSMLRATDSGVPHDIGAAYATLASRTGNLLDALEMRGPRPVSGVASGQRVAAVTASLVPAGGLSEGSLPAGPILLVDDVYSSGWTMTVAASLLEELGATAVYPIVLHRRP